MKTLALTLLTLGMTFSASAAEAAIRVKVGRSRVAAGRRVPRHHVRPVHVAPRPIIRCVRAANLAMRLPIGRTLSKTYERSALTRSGSSSRSESTPSATSARNAVRRPGTGSSRTEP
jgi:hypothetical protein